VTLTRGASQGLYNSQQETGFTHFLSPQDTEWADGTTADYGSLSYTDWNTWTKTIHGGPANTVGLNAVVHLITDDIYIDITFLSWSTGGAYSYQRTTAAPANVPPTITITSPPNGASFSSPATVSLQATASVSVGTVTNVEFFAGTQSLGHVTASPFSLAASLPAAGPYALTAVATAAGVSGTSAVVNITVVTPIVVALTPPSAVNGRLAFSYSANPGLRYVVQGSSNLVNWVPIVTNTAAGTLVPFSEALTATPARYYRVGRLPNP